jgi:hypothetical protein
MAVTNFIPTLWAAQLLQATQTTHVGAGICNRDYEGYIRDQGDTVKITSIGDPTVVDYTGDDLTFENIADASRSLLIDQAKAVAFNLDDVDAAQAVNGGALISEAVDRSAYRLADTLDRFVLDLMATDATTQIAKTTISSAADAYNYLVDWGTTLTELDVPFAGRWAVVTPAFYGKLLKDDRFVGSGAATADGRLVNGLVGQAAGLTIRVSNNLPNGALSTGATVKSVIVGNTAATTLAEQIAKSEATRAEKSFKDLVKFLHVYGARVVRPDFLVSADVVVA